VSIDIPQVAFGVLLPWAYVGIDRLVSVRFPGGSWWRWHGLGQELTFSSVSAIVGLSVNRLPGGTAAAAVMAIIGALIWWHRRRKRRSALGWLGEKSKALRAALVRRMRERTARAPVLRPVRGGAR
jgi:hypothetical protein